MRCRRLVLFMLGMVAAALGQGPLAGAQSVLPIGTVQGRETSSPLEEQVVAIEGVVTARFRSQNSQGRIFHTLFVQESVGDGDPQTADALPVFVGANDVAVKVGDLVRVSGRVQEYFGLTELISSANRITILARNQPLPAAVEWPFLERPEKLEPFEGMLITYGPAKVAGPTHAGCGFALLPAGHPHSHSHRHRAEVHDPKLLAVQYADELNCDSLPPLTTGDQIGSLTGPLNYHFDQWRLLLTDVGQIVRVAGPRPELSTPRPETGAVRLISLNLHNFFDERRHSNHEAEPLVPREVQAARRQKLTAVVANLLHCPALIAVQEVENRVLLDDLARAFSQDCGFVYGVAHEPSVDVRGIDVGVLFSKGKIRVQRAATRQTCTPVVTAVIDEGAGCPADQFPLFSRPPLFVHMQAEGQPLLLVVVHLKSKRGGASATAPIRLAQVAALVEWQQAAGRPLIITGDFNDYRDSPPMERLIAAGLHNILHDLPEPAQYSFIFDGYAQLIDAILVSPELLPNITYRTIVHNSADFPASWERDVSPDRLFYAVSDHDIPLVDFSWVEPEPTPITVVVAPTATVRQAPAGLALQPTVGPQRPTPLFSPVASAIQVASPAPQAEFPLQPPQSVVRWLVIVLLGLGLAIFIWGPWRLD